MKTRVLSGLVMLPLLILVYLGGFPLMLAAAFISFMSVLEFIRGWNENKVYPSKMIILVSILVLYIIHIVCGYSPKLIMAWLLLSTIASFLYSWNLSKVKPVDALVTAASIIYLGLFTYTIVLIDESAYSILIWLVFIASFGSDILAYFSGYLFGKHKLCPDLSPKKTIEGAIGGTLGTTLLAMVFGYFFARDLLIHTAIIGFLGSLFSQAGDLSASAFKRQMGIKDYGNLIPGHGGILDRFDSVIFTAPFVYIYISLILVS